jgi:Tfp pilus assembly protein PilZ
MRGRFAFDDLVPGRYIVATRVFWTEPASYLTRGGGIYDIVEVRKGETTQAVISGK